MFRRTHCICMAKLFSYQLLFGASIWSASVFSLYFDSGWISFRYYCDDARFEFSIHFNHFTCYRTLSLSPTKWYTIKQFKFIWAWDQSFVCGWFFPLRLCVCVSRFLWLTSSICAYCFHFSTSFLKMFWRNGAFPSPFNTHESCWFRANGSIAYAEYEMDIITMGLLFQISLGLTPSTLIPRPPYPPPPITILVGFKSSQMCMHIIEIGESVFV